MNKKLLAVVVGAALAAPMISSADSANVNISGRFRVGADEYKLTGPNGPYHNSSRVDDNLSGFVLSGGEDVGGGLKAWFSVETRFSPDVGSGSAVSGLAYGNTGAGLQGDWGKLTLGRWDLHYTELLAIESLRAGSIAGNASVGLMAQVTGPTGLGVASYIANGVRTNNLIMWDSPNWAGVTARIAYSTAFSSAEGANTAGTYTATDPGKDGAYNIAVRYTAMGITAGVSRWNAKTEGELASTNDQAGDQASTRVWAGYTFPFGLKVGIGVDKSERRFVDATPMTKRTAIEVPVSYTFGDSTPYVTFARAGKLSGGASTDDHSDTGAKSLTIGYDYALSKRTTLGASYAKIDNQARAGYNGYGPHASATLLGSGAQHGDDSTSYFAGISHTF